MPNIGALAALADKYGILSIVDNTVATPALCRPIEHGIDVVVHSASKYTTGQGLAIGGIMVERSNLVEKLRGNARYPQFNEPDASYHGLVYVDVPLPVYTLRGRLCLLRDIGAVGSPFNSWLFIQGLETLKIRMKEHSHNAMMIATFLETQPTVKRVNYPGLASNGNVITSYSIHYTKLYDMDIENQVKQVKKVKKSESGIIIDPIYVYPDATLADAEALMQEYRSYNFV